MRIVVVGCGIVGLWSCIELAERGLEVIAIERRFPEGSACYSSAGYIEVGAIHALAEKPSLAALFSLFRRGSITFSPRFLISHLEWITMYRKRPPMSISYPLIYGLASQSMEMYEELSSSEGLDFELSKRGLMEVFLNEGELESSISEMRSAGISTDGYEELCREEALREEPILSPSVAGAVIYREYGWVNPSRLLTSLKSVAERRGVRLLDCEATSLITSGSMIKAVRTTAGEVSGDAYLFTLGARTQKLLSTANVKIPVAAGRGYAALTKPVRYELKRPLFLADHRIATGQAIDKSLRITSMLVLTDPDSRPLSGVHEEIIRRASLYSKLFAEAEISYRLYGDRPCTPDGLPIIGKLSALEEAYVAVGHCRLGLTLAPATARLIANAITRGSDSGINELLRPSRLGL